MKIIFPDAPCCWYVYLQEFVIRGMIHIPWSRDGKGGPCYVGSGLKQTKCWGHPQRI